MAGRPRTLTLSVTPVLVGAALAGAVEGNLHWPAVLAALAGSVFIQLGTNIHNDAADFERGGDRRDRIGPPRVTASGLLTATAVKRGAIVCFAIAALMGVYLVFVGGWPILMLGLLCIASGWGYTGGPFPIAYTPLGEVFVVAFFGVGAVSGTYFLCTGDINPSRPGDRPRNRFLNWSRSVGEQSSRYYSGCACGAQNIAHCRRTSLNDGNFCRADAVAICPAPADRSSLSRMVRCGLR